jgi:hypothetical protein
MRTKTGAQREIEGAGRVEFRARLEWRNRLRRCSTVSDLQSIYGPVLNGAMRRAIDLSNMAIFHHRLMLASRRHFRDKPALREQTGRELLDRAESVADRRWGPICDTLNMKQEGKELE